MNKKFLIGIGLLVIGLAFVIPTGFASAEPETVRQHFTANECVYMITPPENIVSGKTIHMTGQVNRNDVYSNDPSIFPDAINTAVLDIFLNLQTMKVNFTSTTTIEIPGSEGVFEGRGVGRVNLITGSTSGIGIFHGTGEFEGQTLWMKLSPGDFSQCEEGAFDATHWDAYLISP